MREGKGRREKRKAATQRQGEEREGKGETGKEDEGKECEESSCLPSLHMNLSSYEPSTDLCSFSLPFVLATLSCRFVDGIDSLYTFISLSEQKL